MATPTTTTAHLGGRSDGSGQALAFTYKNVTPEVDLHIDTGFSVLKITSMEITSPEGPYYWFVSMPDASYIVGDGGTYETTEGFTPRTNYMVPDGEFYLRSGSWIESTADPMQDVITGITLGTDVCGDTADDVLHVLIEG